MRLKLAVLAVVTAFAWLAVGAARAEGAHHGWPNHGIGAPGQPNHYGSPHRAFHP